MKTLKIISYDLKGKNKDYNGLINAIKEERGWWHYLDSFWILNTEKSVSDLTDKLKNYLDDEDRLFVFDTETKEYNGWLPQRAYDWIKERIND